MKIRRFPARLTWLPSLVLGASGLYSALSSSSIALAKQTAAVKPQLIEKYAQLYPAAIQCFNEDLEACLVYLKYPEGHRRYIRTTNLLERTFEEEKRRTKVMPQHQNERGAVGLVFAVLWRVSHKWNHVSMTNLELAQLRNIRALICPTEQSTSFISYQLAA